MKDGESVNVMFEKMQILLNDLEDLGPNFSKA